MTELPAGSVTFLFTDIEGSTRLLHELGPKRYAEALAEHRRLLREAFAAHGGVEVDTQGDAFFVAFARASDAVAAAEEAGRHLVDTPVRVRMGVHTGQPIVTEEGYVGVDVHKGARIAAAGYGGQVLLSSSTRDLVDVEVRDLGEHRLKDLTAPERLWQLGHDDFPPPRTLDATNLPVAASPLLGRERELDELLGLFRAGTRLVTVTGPGGTGKTRLALQVAAELVGFYRDGVFWVPLAGVTDPELVIPQIAQTIGARDDLAAHVRDRETLLLVDNLEHLLAAVPALGELLGAAKGLRLLVTSRAPLRVRGEREYPLDPLAENDAVTLFVERARDSGREVAPDETAAAICRRLDSLPLAVELAAARTKVLAPATLLERLDRALPLLTRGPRDAPDRQRTLRATIEWSYDLLDDDAQLLFARLSVFAGSFSLEAGEDVCDADLDTLASLVDLSLLKPIGESRFLMLETIHEYAYERFADSRDAADIRSRHAAFFARMASTLAPEGASDAAEVARAAADLENLRAALAWALENDQELGLRLSHSLRSLWHLRGHYAEAVRWLSAFVDAVDGTRSRGVADVLADLAFFELRRGRNDAAASATDAAQALYEELGDRRGVANCLFHRSWIAADDGEFAPSIRYLEENRTILEELGDTAGVAFSLANLGDVAASSGDLRRAREALEESLDLHESPWGIALASVNLAVVSALLDRVPDAVPLVERGLATAIELGERELAASALDAAAALGVDRDPSRSAELVGAADAARDDLSAYRAGADRKLHERTADALARALGSDRFAAARERGRQLDVDDAAALATRLLSLDSA